MSEVFAYHEGDTPLLISVPHDGWQLPGEIIQHMTGAARGIPDTDWHVAQLYEFTRDLGISMIVANFSRYVVDLNRPADDTALYEGQIATGLCPTVTFAGDDIYRDAPTMDIDQRIEQYWRPYHDRIDDALVSMRERHGCALLWDAHSIKSRVPGLFDGELPVLNLGTWDDRSCDTGIASAVMAVADASPYDAVINARFKGGHITRHYGRPGNDVHAIQLELAQRAYMNETTLEYDKVKASQLRDTLGRLLETFMSAAQR